jgi:hypothetical protein
VVDSREQNGGRITYDGLPIDLASAISRFISPVGLQPRVGLIHYEFVQPMDDRPLGIGTSGGHLIRLAEPTVQAEEVTNWVALVTSGRMTARS